MNQQRRWSKHVSSGGKTYLYDEDSGETRWDEEEGAEGESAWVQHTSSAGHTYYYNTAINVTQWEHPGRSR